MAAAPVLPPNTQIPLQELDTALSTGNFSSLQPKAQLCCTTALPCPLPLHRLFSFSLRRHFIPSVQPTNVPNLPQQWNEGQDRAVPAWDNDRSVSQLVKGKVPSYPALVKQFPELQPISFTSLMHHVSVVQSSPGLEFGFSSITPHLGAALLML